ncbi:MAG TPA: oligosaccharide flippase family protein [Povalibacter sp.]|nr:oligosaccharide flippase family protein [Povalibacter sp.]
MNSVRSNVAMESLPVAGIARRSLRSNVFALGVVQYSGYLLSFLTLPLLARALGASAYGRLSMATALITYASLLVEFGFNYSATRRIALTGDDVTTRRAIFWDVLYARLLLMLAGCGLIFVVAAALLPATSLQTLLLLSLPTVLAAALNTTWYFQGLENVARAAWPNLIPRLLAIPLLLWWVRSPADVGAAALILACSPLLASLINLVQLQRLGEIQFRPPAKARIAAGIRESWPLFLSNAAITLYTSTNVLVLGVLVSESAAAFYAAADKIIRLFHMLIAPLTQAVFPRATRLLHEAPAAATVFVRRLLATQAALGLAFSGVTLLLARFIVDLVFGADFAPASAVLLILAFVPVVTSLSHVFGIQVMVPLGHSRAFGRIVTAAAIVNLGLLVPLTLLFAQVGTALTALSTELFVTVAMSLFVCRRYPQFVRMTPGTR